MSERVETIQWEDALAREGAELILTDAGFRHFMERLGFRYDEDNFLCFEDGTRVESNDFDDVRNDEIGAILPGSAVVIKKSIAAYAQYLADTDKLT